MSIAILAVLTGCAGVGSQQSDLPTAEAVEGSLADLDAVNATVVSTLDGTRITARQTVFEVGTDRRRSTT
ncbi:Outer membrane lipoprotein-sorting protein [Halorhabdus sp. SVX81]|nr:Outer membrane lipoprotein-sorting protein [Halorhabdus sp. SVX81]